ncbi:hypothetical protein BOX15_Mlig008276g1, partial [Macrostomum lignano]
RTDRQTGRGRYTAKGFSFSTYRPSTGVPSLYLSHAFNSELHRDSAGLCQAYTSQGVVVALKFMKILTREGKLTRENELKQQQTRQTDRQRLQKQIWQDCKKALLFDTMCSVRVGKCILLLCSSIALVFSIATSYLSNGNGLEIGQKIGLFESGNTSGIRSWSERGAFTNSSFTPVGWAFTAWIAIYAYQLVVIAHCWTTLCRRAPSGRGFLCNDPDLAPAGLLFWHFIASLFNMAWIFLADRVDRYNYLLIPQTCVLFALAVSLAAALSSSYYWLYVGKRQLALRQSAYWLTVIFVQNGVGLYAGWAVFASFLNLDISLNYLSTLTSETCSFICLGLLNSIVAAYVVMELTTLDRVLRFVFTPHMAIAWASATAIYNKFNGWIIPDILLLLLLSIIGLGLLLKIIAAIVRSKVEPIFPRNSNSYSLKP